MPRTWTCCWRFLDSQVWICTRSQYWRWLPARGKGVVVYDGKTVKIWGLDDASLAQDCFFRVYSFLYEWSRTLRSVRRPSTLRKRSQSSGSVVFNPPEEESKLRVHVDQDVTINDKTGEVSKLKAGGLQPSRRGVTAQGPC